MGDDRQRGGLQVLPAWHHLEDGWPFILKWLPLGAGLLVVVMWVLGMLRGRQASYDDDGAVSETGTNGCHNEDERDHP